MRKAIRVLQRNLEAGEPSIEVSEWTESRRVIGIATWCRITGESVIRTAPMAMWDDGSRVWIETDAEVEMGGADV